MFWLIKKKINYQSRGQSEQYGPLPHVDTLAFVSLSSYSFTIELDIFSLCAEFGYGIFQFMICTYPSELSIYNFLRNANK